MSWVNLPRNTQLIVPWIPSLQRLLKLSHYARVFFRPPLRDTVFQHIQHDYLRELRSGKVFLQPGAKISQKADTWKGFHTPHLGLFDLPSEAKTKLSEIESLMLHYINEPMEYSIQGKELHLRHTIVLCIIYLASHWRWLHFHASYLIVFITIGY
jgi:hypothetical protein